MKSLSAAALLLGFAAAGHAITVEVRNRADDSPALGVGFGRVDAVAHTHHTSPGYLVITQSLSRFRKVFLYTDNGGAFGVSQEGLVNPGLPSLPSAPLYWRDFPGRPEDFTAGEEGNWKRLMEKTLPGFDGPAKEARALIPAGPDGVARVGFGLKTPAGMEGGDYQARIVLEELSDVTDITGPLVEHLPFNDVFLLDIPFGVVSPVEDDGSVAGSTLHFRLEGETHFTDRPMILAADAGNPFRWTAEARLTPGEVRPGKFEYYFTAKDNFDNETRTETFTANLVPADDPVERPMDEAGGRLSIAIGDPAFPGISLDFPASSLSAGQNVSVVMRAPDDLPGFNGLSPLRAFDFGPDGLRFNRPVVLRLPYLDQDQDGVVDGTSVNERDLKIFWFDGREWRFQGGAVDPVNNQVRVQISHFSIYGVFPFAGALSADLVRPQEKIITPNGDGQNDFCTFNISGAFEIEIYTLRGERVRRQSNLSTWDGRNDEGVLVETGTYLYKLRGEGVTVSGMMGVAR